MRQPFNLSCLCPEPVLANGSCFEYSTTTAAQKTTSFFDPHQPQQPQHELERLRVRLPQRHHRRPPPSASPSAVERPAVVDIGEEQQRRLARGPLREGDPDRELGGAR
jgi:hypothetical protein